MSGICAIASSAIVYADLMMMPSAKEPPKSGPVEMQDIKWFIIGGSFGQAAYYTGQTLLLQCAYCVMSFMSELSLLGAVSGLPRAHELTLVCYYFSFFVAVDAIALALLWYILNWREEGWQKVRRAIEARGHRFTELTIAIHVLPVGIGLLDLFVAKDREGILSATPTLVRLGVVCFVYATSYVLLTFWNKRRIGLQYRARKNGFFPYPFMTKIDKKGPKAWLAFICVITGLLWLLMLVVALIFQIEQNHEQEHQLHQQIIVEL
jgi:hypothetical protein